MARMIQIPERCWSDILSGITNRLILTKEDAPEVNPGDKLSLNSQNGIIDATVTTRIIYSSKQHMMVDQGLNISPDSNLKRASTTVVFLDTLEPKMRTPCFM